MKFISIRITSLLLLFVTITGLLMASGTNGHCAGELPDAHQTALTYLVNDLTQVQDNDDHSVPSPSDSTDDHCCSGDCGCPCQAPLAPASVVFSYSPTYTSLFHVEIFRHIPEVYLDRFIPPQNLA